MASLAAVTAASPVNAGNIAARDDDTTVNCNPPRVWRTLKSGFRTFIDNIPDEVYDLDDAEYGLPYGFGTTHRGRAMTANLNRQCDDCGTVATGSHVRSMLHKGYAECVLSGDNDAGDDSFYNFEVRNAGYRINAGGGPAGGSYGTDGTLISVSTPGTD